TARAECADLRPSRPGNRSTTCAGAVEGEPRESAREALWGLAVRACGDQIQLGRRPDDQAAVGDRRGRERRLVQAVLADYLELGAGLHHERIAILAQSKDLSVVGPRRRRECARFGRDALAPVDFLPGLRIVRRQEP